MKDETKRLRCALDDLLVAAEAIVEGDQDWPEQAEWDANLDNLTDAIAYARSVLYDQS